MKAKQLFTIIKFMLNDSSNLFFLDKNGNQLKVKSYCRTKDKDLVIFLN